MRTLARRSLSILSLLMLIPTVGMWARSQWACDSLVRTTSTGGPGARDMSFTRVVACRGSLAVERDTWRGSWLPGSRAEGFVGALPPGTTLARTTTAPRDVHPFGPAATRFGFAWFGSPPHGERRVDPSTAAVMLGLGTIWVTHRTVAAPWWFLTVLFATAPALSLRRWRKARRRQPHECAGCRYDLRATADPAGPLLPTCPECGRASAAPGSEAKA